MITLLEKSVEQKQQLRVNIDCEQVVWSASPFFLSDAPTGKQFNVVWHFSFRLWYFHFCFTDQLILFVLLATIYTVSFVSANIISRNYQRKGEKNTNLAISVTMNFVLFFIFLMLQWSIIAIAIDYRIVFLLLK